MISAVGQYNILERLGGGALGDVYRARDTRAGRTVALMVPPPQLLASPARRARFLEDARKAAKLNHQNIAMLFDIVEQDGGCYLAYEFAEGPSLREEMGSAALEARLALHLATHVADALAAGHASGIVHGDVRPDTIVVTPKGSVKVLSFGMTMWTTGGLARAKAAAGADALDREEALVAAYLSPEQARGAAGDPRSDLFALGIVLYEMLTGVQPFAAATPRGTIANVESRMPAPPSAVNPHLPAELDALDAIVMRLLAKGLDHRYQTASDVAADIRRVTRRLDATNDEPGRRDPRTRQEKPRHGAVWLALLAVIAMAAAAWWFFAT
jgi:serine/threonine-protein kinase